MSAVRVLLAAVCCLGAVTVASAQTASITGIALDQDRSVLTRAAVTVTPVPSGLPQTVLSGADGRFTVAQLSAGRYVVEIHADGFRTFAQEVQLGAQPADLVATLQVAGFAEDVTVLGAATTPT